jgi:hypothetical protein
MEFKPSKNYLFLLNFFINKLLLEKTALPDIFSSSSHFNKQDFSAQNKLSPVIGGNATMEESKENYTARSKRAA